MDVVAKRRGNLDARQILPEGNVDHIEMLNPGVEQRDANQLVVIASISEECA